MIYCRSWWVKKTYNTGTPNTSQKRPNSLYCKPILTQELPNAGAAKWGPELPHCTRCTVLYSTVQYSTVYTHAWCDKPFLPTEKIGGAGTIKVKGWWWARVSCKECAH